MKLQLSTLIRHNPQIEDNNDLKREIEVVNHCLPKNFSVPPFIKTVRQLKFFFADLIFLTLL